MSYGGCRDSGQRSLCLLTAAVNNIYTILTLTYMCWEDDMPLFHCSREPAGVCGVKVVVGRALLMANLMLTSRHGWFSGPFCPANAQLSGRLCKVCGAVFTSPLSPPPWRRFLFPPWSPWKTPISAWLRSLWNQFSLFCSYSPPVAMDTAPHWFDWSVNLFISSSREWRGPFLHSSGSQSKCGFFARWALRVITFGEFLRSFSGATVEAPANPNYTTCDIGCMRAAR